MRLPLLIPLLLAAAARAAPPATQPAETPTDKALAALPLFPSDDPWHADLSKLPAAPNSTAILATIGLTKPLHPDFGTHFGIPFQLVDANTPRVSPTFKYAGESDKGPYPIPANPLIEGGPNAPKASDRHILCIDPQSATLYELYNANLSPAGQWVCGSGAIFDLRKRSTAQRPVGWTSADAAGLPIFPGLVRYDEVARGKITHALRFTVVKSRNTFVPPASHAASNRSDPDLPPMGTRLRLKSSVDITSFPKDDQVILTALKTYGLILADNGSDLFVSGAPDPRWNDDHLNLLKKIKTADFEVVAPPPPAP